MMVRKVVFPEPAGPTLAVCDACATELRALPVMRQYTVTVLVDLPSDLDPSDVCAEAQTHAVQLAEALGYDPDTEDDVVDRVVVFAGGAS